MTHEEALKRVHSILTSRRQSISFAAPELQDMHWNVLAEDLEDLLEDIFEEDE